MNDQSWFQQWNTLAFAVEQNLDNDITSDGMTVNKEGDFGFFGKLKLRGLGLVNKGYDILLYFMFKLKTYLLQNSFLALCIVAN